MSDIVDETVTTWWSEISSLVGSGLNDEKPLSSYVNVSDRPVDETYKVVNFEWVIAHQLMKPEYPPPEDNSESLHQAHLTALGAYRLSHTTGISIDTRPDIALINVRAFASDARRLERRWVLWLLMQYAKEVQVNLSNTEAVRKVMNGGSYRLISSVDAPNLKSIVSEQVAVPAGVEVYGLLVRSDGNGPLVTRVGGGDISLTWCRSFTPRRVTLILTSTFFLDNPEQTLNLR